MKAMRIPRAVLISTIVLGCLAISVGTAQTNRTYEGTTIRFLRHSGYEADWMRDQLAAFEAATGIRVEMDTISYSNMRAKQVIELSTGTDASDVYAIPDFWVGEYAGAGWLAPLDGFLADPALADPAVDLSDIPEALLNVNRYDGALVVFPFKYNTRLLFYRVDLLEDLGVGVPETWSEFLDIAAQLTRDGKFGADLSAAQANLTDLFRDFLESAGGDLFTADSQPAFNSEAGIRAVNFMKQVLEFAPAGALTRQWPDTANLMAQGVLGMGILIPNFAGELNDPEKSTVVGQIGFAPIPGDVSSTTYVSSWGLGINANSRNPEAAFLFVQWLLAPERVRQLTIDTGGAIVPSYASILDDPVIVSTFPQMPAAKRAADGAWMWEPLPVIEEAKQIIARNVQDALTGSVTAEQALAQAEREVIALFREAGL